MTEELPGRPLPAYKSNVVIGIVISIVFKILALWQPDMFTDEMEAKTLEVAFLFISIGGDLYALIFRWFSRLQPLVLFWRRTNGVPVVLLAMLLGGCVTTQQPGLGATTPGIVRTALDVKISQRSAQLAAYCGQVQFGLGLAGGYITTPKHQQLAQKAAAAVIAYCAKPPTNLSTAIATLANAIEAVQAVGDQRL